MRHLHLRGGFGTLLGAVLLLLWQFGKGAVRQRRSYLYACVFVCVCVCRGRSTRASHLASTFVRLVLGPCKLRHTGRIARSDLFGTHHTGLLALT